MELLMRLYLRRREVIPYSPQIRELGQHGPWKLLEGRREVRVTEMADYEDAADS